MRMRSPVAEGWQYPENVECIEETPAAIRVQATESKKRFWVPKSVLHDDSETYKMGTDGTLIVAEWFAEKEGWD